MHHLKIRFGDLFVFDREALNLTKPTVGIAIVLVALILFSIIGGFGFMLAFGAVLTVAFDPGGPRRRRLAALTLFAVAGALATLLGNWAGPNIWDSIAVIFVVTLLCGLALAYGPQTGLMAFFVNLWTMIAISLSPILYAPVILTLGFFCGSGLVLLALLFLDRSGPAVDATPADGRLQLSLAPARAQLHRYSPVLHFAASRAVGAAVAMALGWLIAPTHPFWIAMTLLIVLVPDREQAARTSWQRAIGTVIGVALGALILSFNLPEITLLLVWLLVTLIMLAVQAVNYVLYATILTLNLLLFYQLLEADVAFNGIERLVTTLLGIAFALGIIVLLEALAARARQAEQTGGMSAPG